MTIPVYSYKKGDVAERLRTHVKYALETFDEDSRLVRYGRSIKRTFYETLKYAIILHDFGKVPFNQAEPAKPELGFEGHEVLSAWFADRYLSQAVRDGIIDPCDKCLALLAILLHHHPMGVERRGERLSKRNICINESTIELFYEELEGIIPQAYRVPLRGAVCASDVVLEVLERNGVFDRCWSEVWMNGGPTERKTLLLLEQGLIAADYRSAGLSRGAEISEFAKAVEIFLRNWE